MAHVHGKCGRCGRGNRSIGLLTVDIPVTLNHTPQYVCPNCRRELLAQSDRRQVGEGLDGQPCMLPFRVEK